MRDFTRQIAKSHVFGKDQLVEALQHRGGCRQGDIQENHVASFEDMHVRCHPALWREPRGIAAGTSGERLDVVGEQPLQVRRAVRPGDREQAPPHRLGKRRTFPNQPVIVVLGHGVGNGVGMEHGLPAAASDLIRSRNGSFLL